MVKDIKRRIGKNGLRQFAVFGGGCFWCTEALFSELRGIISVQPGYAGGYLDDPTYEEVSLGQTGHAEVILIEFDPDQISYEDLLTVFFFTHDPTVLNRQGSDTGTQYRSIILATTSWQKVTADNFIEKLSEAKAYDKVIVTEVEMLKKFYPAEDYHKKYYELHKDETYCQLIIEPKVTKLREKFLALLAEPKKITERPFSGKYLHEDAVGIYRCAFCNNPLFSSVSKFNSGTGWPSFDKTFKGAVKLRQDNSAGLSRTEVLCARCGSHLGHVFDDGPQETTGKRYCINSVCLELEDR